MKRLRARTLLATLILSVLPMPGAPAVGPPSRAAVPETPDEEPPVEAPSPASLDIRLHPADAERLRPPATMRLTDPRGRATGFEPESGHAVTCIPRSWYEEEGIDDAESGAPGPRSLVLHLAAPEPGRYELEVHGTAPGRYHLEAQATDRSLETSRALREDVGITAGTTHRYTLDYSDAPASPLDLTGPVTSAPR